MLSHRLLGFLLGVQWVMCGEIYTFFLNIKDRLHEDWMTEDVRLVTRTECAALCYQRGNCGFFGYKESHCLLLKNTLDGCIGEECPEDEGMKIYELRKDPVSTTMTSAVTEESTTKAVETTTQEITTTTLKTTTPVITTKTTTTTTQPTTLTTKKPATTTATEKTTFTTTEEPTTKAATTSTMQPTTTTTKETTTTTTTAPETTTTAPKTTTTKETTSTTEKITTTTGATSTTTVGNKFSCEPPKGAQADAECPTDTWLLNALGSKSPFFGDVLSPKCYDFKENIYDKNIDDVYYFFSVDKGITINAECPGKHDVIVKYSLCVIDAHIPAIVLHCSPIKDKDRILDIFNTSSEAMKDTLVNCDSKAGFQKMFFQDADGKGVVTRVTYQCILFDVPDDELDSTLGKNKPDEVG